MSLNNHALWERGNSLNWSKACSSGTPTNDGWPSSPLRPHFVSTSFLLRRRPRRPPLRFFLHPVDLMHFFFSSTSSLHYSASPSPSSANNHDHFWRIVDNRGEERFCTLGSGFVRVRSRSFGYGFFSWGDFCNMFWVLFEERLVEFIGSVLGSWDWSRLWMFCSWKKERWACDGSDVELLGCWAVGRWRT